MWMDRGGRRTAASHICGQQRIHIGVQFIKRLRAMWRLLKSGDWRLPNTQSVRRSPVAVCISGCLSRHSECRLILGHIWIVQSPKRTPSRQLNYADSSAIISARGSYVDLLNLAPNINAMCSNPTLLFNIWIHIHTFCMPWSRRAKTHRHGILVQEVKTVFIYKQSVQPIRCVFYVTCSHSGQQPQWLLVTVLIVVIQFGVNCWMAYKNIIIIIAWIFDRRNWLNTFHPY